MSDHISLETKTVQALGRMDEETHSLVPPLYPSTTFLRNPDLSYHEGHVYTRADNPTYRQASRLLAELENGQSARLFSSGMAAAVAVFQCLEKGDHVILPRGVYGGTRTWAERYLVNWGISVSSIADGDIGCLEDELRRRTAKIVWIETPANPNWSLTDIREFSDAAHRAGALVVCDNTVATPVLTRPLDLGADLVLHSATKYLNGHGDILMGALVTREENATWKKIETIAHDGGALPGTFEAWLLLRGMRTLFLRMERICRNAMTVAEFLASHPKIRVVYYPGLPGFPGHEIARRQMTGGFGGMISLRMKDKAAAVKLQAGTQVFRRATSLGTVESLIEHRSSYEGKGTRVPDDLIRLSVGIENAADLVADMEEALENIG